MHIIMIITIIIIINIICIGVITRGIHKIIILSFFETFSFRLEFVYCWCCCCCFLCCRLLISCLMIILNRKCSRKAFIRESHTKCTASYITTSLICLYASIYAVHASRGFFFSLSLSLVQSIISFVCERTRISLSIARFLLFFILANHEKWRKKNNEWERKLKIQPKLKKEPTRDDEKT